MLEELESFLNTLLQRIEALERLNEKRPRGRPRKSIGTQTEPEAPKRGRGRPRKAI